MGNILYSFRRCPYAMRARMALCAAQIEYEHREIILRDKPASMLAASPKGTVPVFIKSGGEVIDESLDLMHWALSQNDPHNWMSADKNQTADLISQNDGPFKHHLDRYKYPSRYGDAGRGQTDSAQRDAACEIIAGYEDRLKTGRNLTGDAPTLADIAIFPFMRQFANTDRAWWDNAPYPQTRAWLERHLASPVFIAIMKKHALWTD